MDIGNTQDWQQGAGALKAGIDALRSVYSLLKDFRSSGEPTQKEREVVDQALIEAEKASAIAQAQLAKALGYELCHCQFPPTAMLTVGWLEVRGTHKSDPVYECPKCGYTTAGPWTYTRTVPERVPTS